MSRVHKAFAFLFLVLFIASIASPLTFHENLVPYAYRDTTFTPATTDYVVNIREYNNLLAFNDDDFEFTVLNGSIYNSIPGDSTRVGEWISKNPFLISCSFPV